MTQCSVCEKTNPIPCTRGDCPIPLVSQYDNGAQQEHAQRDLLLQERKKTHGDFTKNAEISQQLKRIFRHEAFPMHNRHSEALDMIALKLSRILSGQADYADHWDDIAGYAKLASEVCPK